MIVCAARTLMLQWRKREREASRPSTSAPLHSETWATAYGTPCVQAATIGFKAETLR